MAEERLQKVLAQAGIGSRRACEEIILSGRVTVDGRVVSVLGTKVDPDGAVICVDGQRIAGERLRYVMLNKPAGYLSGLDPRAEYPSWQQIVKVPERLFAVGRLDQDSEGLLLLTNDGELAQRLLHPRYEHPKTYLAQVEGRPNPRKVRRLQHGVMLEDGPTTPAHIAVLREPPFPERPVAPGAGRSDEKGERSERPRMRAEGHSVPPRAGRPGRIGATSWLRVTLFEGRKRQLRRMLGLLGHPALRVVRISMGPLRLGDLRPGKWRDLTAGEIRALRDSVMKQGTEVVETPRALAPSTIAIDGPAASGKSTVGGLLAGELGYLYLDTGVMYRAIAAVALDREVTISDEPAVTMLAENVRLDVLPPTVADGRDVTVLADGEDITPVLRTPEVERAVSPVSAYAGVRRAMVEAQRRIGRAGRVVMVGRDIGTVVMPDAELKIYLDATPSTRAERRLLERRARGEPVAYELVLAELKRRDEFDAKRAHSPLTPAKDAILVNSTDMNVEQVMSHIRLLIERWHYRRREAR